MENKNIVSNIDCNGDKHSVHVGDNTGSIVDTKFDNSILDDQKNIHHTKLVTSMTNFISKNIFIITEENIRKISIRYFDVTYFMSKKS